MYKLVIAEDERATRELLAAQDWEAMGLELVGAYENGLKAYEKIAACDVDIVLTDIRMPIMDGLKLIAALRQEYPHILCLILSGYNEYPYLRQSIQLEVADYILKPVDDAELAAACGRAVERLKQRQEAECLEAERMGRLRRGTEAIRREFLRKLFTARLDRDTIDELSAYSEVDVADRQLAVCLFRFDHLDSVKERSRPERWDLKLFGLQKCLDDYFSSEPEGYVWVDRANGDVMAIIPIQDGTEKSVVHDRIRAMKAAVYEMRGLFQDTLSAAVCVVPDAAAVYPCSLRLRMCMEGKSGESAVLLETFSLLPDEEALPAPAAEKAASDVSGHQRAVIEKISRYVEEHYADPITLGEMADMVYMNAVYVSQLFKKAMGVKFIDYLVGLRMKKAKELLLQPDLPVYQVGLQVGYTSPQYFCQVFRREAGVSPNEFRNQIG